MSKSLFIKTTLLSALFAFGFVGNALANLTDYSGGAGAQKLAQAFARGDVHILQIGDSHTAGDYFTESLRKRLQSDLGDGGVGFMYPAKLSGQRTARHGYSANSWRVLNSRTSGAADYPLGGVLAISDGTPLTFTSQYYNNDRQNVAFVVKARAGDVFSLQDRRGNQTLTATKSGWQTVNAAASFPFSLSTSSGAQVGGVWARKKGGTVSAMGINGAVQDYWRRWSDVVGGLAASNADLVILAYGTNEAYQDNVASQPAAVQSAIDGIKAALPQATILLLSAPDSLKNVATCTPPPSLAQVQSNLQNAAQKNGTLFYDWQAMMGGKCAMKTWIGQGLAIKDGVHFSKAGYEKAGNALYDDLKRLINATANSGSAGLGGGYASGTATSGGSAGGSAGGSGASGRQIIKITRGN